MNLLDLRDDVASTDRLTRFLDDPGACELADLWRRPGDAPSAIRPIVDGGSVGASDAERAALVPAPPLDRSPT